jgi:hypothetical protein
VAADVTAPRHNRHQSGFTDRPESGFELGKQLWVTGTSMMAEGPEPGYKGLAGDCVCRAIAIATGIPYGDVYDAINREAQTEKLTKRREKRSSARTGVHKPTTRRYLASLGWTWIPTMRIGSGCTVHLRAGELPSGRLIVLVSRHVVAVIDGTIHDTHDSSRDGTRCVYGYFQKLPA